MDKDAKYWIYSANNIRNILKLFKDVYINVTSKIVFNTIGVFIGTVQNI
jgi:hypothetical protein